MKVKLKDDSRGITAVTAMKQVSSIDGTFSDAVTKDKARLVIANKRWDQRLKLARQDLGDAFDRGVLKCNKPEIASLSRIFLFMKKNQVGTIDMFKVSSTSVKRFKQGINVSRGDGPGSFEEGRTKAVRARTSIGVHATDNKLDLIRGERSVKVTERERPLRIEIVKLKVPVSISNTPHEIMVESMKDKSFLLMVVDFNDDMLNQDSVATATLVSTSMKIAGILIALNGSPDLTALFPKSELGVGGTA